MKCTNALKHPWVKTTYTEFLTMILELTTYLHLTNRTVIDYLPFNKLGDSQVTKGEDCLHLTLTELEVRPF
jgi:hypothetical protein